MHIRQVQRDRAADVQQFDKFGQPVTCGMIHQLADHEIALGVRGPALVSRRVVRRPGGVDERERFPETGKMPFVAALHEKPFTAFG